MKTNLRNLIIHESVVDLCHASLSQIINVVKQSSQNIFLIILTL